jgi:hypothetical protein
MNVPAVRTRLAVGAVAALALIAAGCGGSKPPGVASLGPTTTNSATTPKSSSPPAAGKPSATAFVAFVDCLQRHGIAAQLGQGGHGVSITGGDPNAPQFRQAQQACQKLLPGGGPQPLTPAEQAQERAELLKLATCMRTHGYPSFPDPDGQGAFDFTGSSVNPNAPQFQQAMSACRPGNSKVPLRIGIRVNQNGASHG